MSPAAVESPLHMTWQLFEGALQFVIAPVVPALVWPAKAAGCRLWAGLGECWSRDGGVDLLAVSMCQQQVPRSREREGRGGRET